MKKFGWLGWLPALALGCVSFQEDPFVVVEGEEVARGSQSAVGGALHGEADQASGGAAGAPSCPAECTGGCEGAVCHFECSGDACRDAHFTCPPTHDCSVSCDGKESCRGTELRCGPDQGCDWKCSGKSACRDSRLFCDGGICARTCAGAASCEGAELRCGASGVCQADCDPGAGLQGVCDASATCDYSGCSPAVP